MTSPYFSEHDIQDLLSLAKIDLKKGIKIKFEENKQRAEQYSSTVEDIYFDFSKTHISQSLMNHYIDSSKKRLLKKAQTDFLSGKKINNTEQRAVLHTLLRDSDNQGIDMVDPALTNQAQVAKNEFEQKLNEIERSLQSRDRPIENIIHVGIGGSSLGTQLLFESLKKTGEHRKIHFLGNIDAHQIDDILAVCDVNTTMVIGVSKTFTTAETLQNLDTITAWFKSNGVQHPLSNFYGVTANPSAAKSYGLNENNVVSFPEWVGGRYSVWSSVSLSAALILGKDRFNAFLDGAALMDTHFYSADFEKNICFQAAVLDHYYANFMNVGSKAIFAYDYRFRSLVDYLQQLETESNGKDRHKDGKKVDGKTSMVVWGGVGTDVQHSVFQMLHQGTSMIPSEFILVKNADHEHSNHHNELLANGIAQTAALLEGQSLEKVNEIHASTGLSKDTLNAKVFKGDKPSTTILLERMTPKALGALLAFYEHRVFFGGVLSDINSFDQMGVELGKRLANEIRPLIDKEQSTETGFDQSTELLLRKLFQ